MKVYNLLKDDATERKPLMPEIKHLSYEERRKIISQKVEELTKNKEENFTIAYLATSLGLTRQQYLNHTLPYEKIAKLKERLKFNREKFQSTPFFHLKRKTENFQKRSEMDISFDFNDVIKKFGEKPICYLTGLPIDYNKPETYQMDHYIPASKGGKSNLDNLKLAHPMANEMKRDYDLKKFVEICELIAARKEILLNPIEM